MLALGTKRETPERFIWDWKEQIDAGGDGWGPPALGWDGVAVMMAAALSAYFEAHADRLFADRPIVTYVPSRGPLIASLASLAHDRGWFAPEVQPSGRKTGAWYQHSTSQDLRLARTADDWTLDARLSVAGRPVVLIDDVFVTGASLFSYATALSHAGASEVRAVALIRHLADSHWNYWDALRISRRSHPNRWTPDRVRVAELASPKRQAHALHAGDELLAELHREWPRLSHGQRAELIDTVRRYRGAPPALEADRTEAR
jgi:hypothetical protein